MTEVSAHINIKEAQFEVFERALLGVVMMQPTIHEESCLRLSDKEKSFLVSYVLDESGTSLRLESHFWLRVYRDTLADALGFDDQGDCKSKPLLPKMERMSLMTQAHDMTLQKIAEKRGLYCGEFLKIKGSNPRHKLSKAQKLFVDLPGDLSAHVPLFLSVAIGKYLGYQRGVSSDSFIYAGKSYNMKCFCDTLYGEMLAVNDGTNPALEDSDESEAEEELNVPDIRGGTTQTNYIRACVLNVWAKKLAVDKLPFSTDKLLGDWLLDGIQLFNANVGQWALSSSEGIGPVPPEIHGNIRKLASGWLKNMNGKHRNKLHQVPDQEPSTAFVPSVLIPSKRADWEAYCSMKILQSKVQLCGAKRDRPVGASKTSEKRRAIVERISGQSSVFTSEAGESLSAPSTSPSNETTSGTKQIIGALANLFQDSMKQEELLIRQLMDNNNRNTERLVQAQSSRRMSRHSTPKRQSRSPFHASSMDDFDEDDFFEDE